MAATSPVNSVWTGKSTRLCCLSSRRPDVLLSCQLVVASPLVVLSLHCPLVVLLHQLLHSLLPSSLCATLSSTRRASLLMHRLSLSSCCALHRPLVLSLAGWLLRCLSTHRSLIVSSLVVLPLVVSSRQLVVAPSSYRPLVLSSCWLVVVLLVLAPPSRPLVVVHHQRHRTFYTVVTLLLSMLHYFTR